MKGLSVKALARLGGGLYVLNIVSGAFAIGYVNAAVGSDVHGHETLFRAGVAAHVVVTMTNVGLALVFYELFKVVSRRGAMLVVFFTLVATAIEASGVAGQLAALSFGPGAAAYDVSTVFFAGYALAIGYLIYRSTFMPRAIGVLMAVDGAAYLLNSFATIIAPGFAAHLVPYVQLPILLGEGPLALWLLIAGVDEARWRQRQRGGS